MIDVFISVGRTANEKQEIFVRAVLDHLRANGLNPRALGRSDWSSEQPLKFIGKLMDQCAGTVIIAFERIFIAQGAEHRLSAAPVPLEECKITTPWNQIEAAMAYSRKQPLLVLMEDGLRSEGLLDIGFDWWVQACPLNSSSMQTSEFIGVFSDWKNRVEQYDQGSRRSSSLTNLELDQMTVGQLLGALRPKQLWAPVLILASVLGGAFTAGHTWGPIVLGSQQQPANVVRGDYDNQATLKALKTLAEREPPFYGNSDDGNARPQMVAYITSFEVSDNPKILRTIRNLLSEVEARENPESPKEYFFADNSFRAELDSFLSKVRVYSETGEWEP